MSDDALPAAFAPIRAYMDRARELQSVSATVSHQLRMHAASLALKIKQRDAPATRWLARLLDALEQEKQRLGPLEDPPGTTMRALAYDIYERARALDKPNAFPNATDRWAVVDAPRIAQGLHASAVLLDALSQHGALSPIEMQLLRAAHSRSQVLSAQLCRALKMAPVVPQWQPVARAAPVPTLAEAGVEAPKPASAADDLPDPPTQSPSSMAQASVALASDGRTVCLTTEVLQDATAPPAHEVPAHARPANPFPEEVQLHSGAGSAAAVAAAAAEPTVATPDVAAPEGAPGPGSPPRAPLPRVRSLPPGWEARLDQASGRTYYVDYVNKATRWELPTAAPSVQVRAPGPARGHYPAVVAPAHQAAAPMATPAMSPAAAPASVATSQPVAPAHQAAAPVATPAESPAAAPASAAASQPPAAAGAAAAHGRPASLAEPASDSDSDAEAAAAYPAPFGAPALVPAACTVADSGGGTSEVPMGLSLEPMGLPVEPSSPPRYSDIGSSPAPSGYSASPEPSLPSLDPSARCSSVSSLGSAAATPDELKMAHDLSAAAAAAAREVATVDRMWDRMRLDDPPPPSFAASTAKSSGAGAESEREAEKRERAAIRARAVQNVTETQRMVAESIRRARELGLIDARSEV